VQRFYSRYSAVIGGETWADVRRYLKEARPPVPTSVEQWIAAAKSRADDQPSAADRSGTGQRQHARH